MKRWHRITLQLLVLHPIIVLSVWFFTDGSLAWTLVAVVVALAVTAIEYVAQGEATKVTKSRFGFLFWEIKTMRAAYIFAACAYPVLVLAFLLLGQGWLSSLAIPLGAVGGLLLGQRMRLGGGEEQPENEAAIRGPGWHPHPEHPEWWFYWDGDAWSDTAQRRPAD
ncbi:MAG TPA: hypothetical protein VNT92_03895 [Acidimicrobiia bacterium]|nr:hypothetical protein [Acidimicrobiia bacterium]